MMLPLYIRTDSIPNLHSSNVDSDPSKRRQMDRIQPLSVASTMNVNPTFVGLPKTTDEQAKVFSSTYTPGPYDIICGRGTVAWNHSGNRYFRALVKSTSDTYSKSKSRAERSAIVSDIVDKIRSIGNGFIKQDEVTGQWSDVGELLAREKIGQMLRNSLSKKYRSSLASKNKRRRGMHARRIEILQNVMNSNNDVHESMETIKEASKNDTLSDDALMALFQRQQQSILRVVQSDKSLVNKFVQAEVAACLVMNNDDSSSSCVEDNKMKID